MPSLLSPAQRELVSRVEALLDGLLPILEGLEAPPEAERRLREAIEGLHGLFLLVVAGEFNSGKSALVNSLLGGSFLEEGVTPTTRTVQLLVFGTGDATRGADGTLRRPLACPALETMHIVDTPGTNAILREHEALTRDFVPRADLVVFVTSADRPFTESERSFLEMIKGWGKKIVFVVNKIDLLATAPERREVVAFVRAGAEAVIESQPVLFAVSAKEAQAARGAGDAHALEASGLPDLEAWLHQTLTADERWRLKLDSPLGVADKVTADLQARSDARLAVLRSDAAALQELDAAVAAFVAAAHEGGSAHLDRIDLLLGRMRERGEEFLDDHVRLTRLPSLLDGKGLQRAFAAEVIDETPREVEAEVGRLIDAVIDAEHETWVTIRRTLVDRPAAMDTSEPVGTGAGFAARRRALLDSVGRQAEDVVSGFDVRAEGARVAAGVHDALTRTAVVEAGALGLGLVLKAILTSAVADATGLLAAGVLAMLGLTILPYRRRKAVATLRRRTEELRQELRATLGEALDKEITSSATSMRASTAPYREFLRAETDRLEAALAQLAASQDRSSALRARLGP